MGIRSLVVTWLVVPFLCWGQATPDLPSFQATSVPDIRRVSETYGHFLGQELKKQEMQLQLEDVIAGLRGELAGEPAPLTSEEYEKMVKYFQDHSFRETAEHNLTLANAFITSNGKKPGVVALVPGKVQYRILQPGSGARVEENGVPVVHYTGRYLDGTLFGSSDEVGGSILIPINQMIPGFRDGLVGMREGETRRLFVHPDYAYGVSGEIPPNSLLIFDVEVLQAEAGRPNTVQARKGERLDKRLSSLPPEKEPVVWEEEEPFSRQPLHLHRVR